MNYVKLDTDTSVDDEATPAAKIESDKDNLFMGDYGELALETRRALIQLLAGPSLEKRRHGKLWEILIQDEALIRRRLSELFLELIIDSDLQVAFTRQADTGELEVPTLLRRTQLTFIDSLLLLYLRQRLTQADTQNERGVVDMLEITEYLALYERTASTDRAGFIKRINAAIEKFKKYNLLRKIRASEQRFEISSTLKLLFSAEEIQALTKLYQHMQISDLVSAIEPVKDTN